VIKHAALTSSPRAKWILQNWSEVLPRFIKVFPHEHKRVLGRERCAEQYNPVRELAAVASEVQHG
jgi:glutamate synthase domain-containing protein 3